MAKLQVGGLCVLLSIFLIHAYASDLNDFDEYDDILDIMRNFRQELLDTEKKIDKKISRTQNRIQNNVQRQLPRLVEDHLVDLLKYHRYDKTLSEGHKSETEKLTEGLMQMKSRMHHFSRRLSSSEAEKVVLKGELAKNALYTRRLEQDLKLMKTQNNQFEDRLLKKLPTSCSCNQSESRITPRSVTSSAKPKPTPKARQPVVPKVEKIQGDSGGRTKIIAVSQENPSFVQITLKDRKMKALPMKSGLISSVAFDPASNRTIWSNYGPEWISEGIYSSDLNTDDEATRLSTMTASAMVVDSARKWIIFTTVRPRKTISRIGTIGGDFTEIREMTKYSDQQDIAVDPYKELIFTCDGDYIIETGYNGKHQRVLLTGGFIVSLALDVDKDILYYYEFDSIKEVHPKTGETDVVKDNFGEIPKNLIFYKGKLYFGGYFENFVKVLDTKTLVVTNLGNLKGKSISICLVS